MNTFTTEDTTARIWVGCLACHNAGRLVGEWFDAIDGDTLTVADVHRGQDCVPSNCEEICFCSYDFPGQS